jgi:hypothetical protein
MVDGGAVGGDFAGALAISKFLNDFLFFCYHLISNEGTSLYSNSRDQLPLIKTLRFTKTQVTYYSINTNYRTMDNITALEFNRKFCKRPNSGFRIEI